MKPGLSTFVAICLTGVAVTAAQAQPQVVVKDKLPAGAADAPSTAPSPEVLTQSREAISKAAKEASLRNSAAAFLARNLANADVILQVPVRITGLDMSRLPKGPETERLQDRWELRLECEVMVVYDDELNRTRSFSAWGSMVLTPRITNGSLDIVQDLGFPLVKPVREDRLGRNLRDVTYKCGLYYGPEHAHFDKSVDRQLCLHNASGSGNACLIEGQIPGTF
jgi:hypothetical protein